jgi:hypothetical protein
MNMIARVVIINKGIASMVGKYKVPEPQPQLLTCHDPINHHSKPF